MEEPIEVIAEPVDPAVEEAKKLILEKHTEDIKKCNDEIVLILKKYNCSLNAVVQLM